MSVRQSTDRSRWDVVPDLIFAGALTLSYASLYRLAISIGFPSLLAIVYPAIIDGFIVYAAREAEETAGHGEHSAKRWAFALVIVFTAISGGLQAWDGYRRAEGIDPRLSAVAHAVPAVAVLLAFEMRQRRAARRTRLAAVAAGAADRAALEAELRPVIEAEIRTAAEAEAATLRAEIRRLTNRQPQRPPGRTSPPDLRALPGGSSQRAGGTKQDRAAAILASRPDITAPELAAELACSDRYARSLKNAQPAAPAPAMTNREGVNQ